MYANIKGLAWKAFKKLQIKPQIHRWQTLHSDSEKRLFFYHQHQLDAANLFSSRPRLWIVSLWLHRSANLALRNAGGPPGRADPDVSGADSGDNTSVLLSEVHQQGPQPAIGQRIRRHARQSPRTYTLDKVCSMRTIGSSRGTPIDLAWLLLEEAVLPKA